MLQTPRAGFATPSIKVDSGAATTAAASSTEVESRLGEPDFDEELRKLKAFLARDPETRVTVDAATAGRTVALAKVGEASLEERLDPWGEGMYEALLEQVADKHFTEAEAGEILYRPLLDTDLFPCAVARALRSLTGDDASKAATAIRFLEAFKKTDQRRATELTSQMVVDFFTTDLAGAERFADVKRLAKIADDNETAAYVSLWAPRIAEQPALLRAVIEKRMHNRTDAFVRSVAFFATAREGTPALVASQELATATVEQARRELTNDVETVVAALLKQVVRRLVELGPKHSGETHYVDFLHEHPFSIRLDSLGIPASLCKQLVARGQYYPIRDRLAPLLEPTLSEYGLELESVYFWNYHADYVLTRFAALPAPKRRWWPFGR